MTLPQIGKPFTPDEADQYQGLDRGLFLGRNLTLTDGFGDLTSEDVYCRIGRIEVYNFQGISNFCIIGYQVMAFRKQPINEADYKDNFIYVDPRAPKINTYYFQAVPQGMSARMLEQMCISDFINQVRAKEPSKWPTRAALYEVFAPFKDALMVAPGNIGVDNVSHFTLFTSTDGKPVTLAQQTLRYRGYELDAATQTRLPKWVYGATQFLMADKAFFDRTRMVVAAKEDFATRVNEAKELLGIS